MGGDSVADSLILTTVGLAKLAVATPESPVQITHLAVGDGSGGYPPLLPSMTALAREVWRGVASAPIREPDSPTVIKFETVIPASAGGFFIRELGLFDSTGALIAVAQCGVVEKPSAMSSTALTMTATMRLTLANASQTQVVINDQPYIDHQALSNRKAQDAHPMAAITGLTGSKEIATGGPLPATASGAYEIVSDLSSIYVVLPKIADLAADVELLFFLSPSSVAASYVVASAGDALRSPVDILSGAASPELVLPAAGDWVRLRSNKAAREWVAVAASAFRKDPTDNKRGMPLAATQPIAEAGTDNTRMMTALRVMQLIRAATTSATEALRGVLRIGTQVEVNAGTADDLIVTPKKLRSGFISSFGAIGYIFLPTWMGGFGLQWGVVDASPAPGEQTITFPTAFPVACYGIISTFKFATDIGSFSGTYLTVNSLLNNSARFLATIGRYWMAWGK
jgi:hypothetical protein